MLRFHMRGFEGNPGAGRNGTEATVEGEEWRRGIFLACVQIEGTHLCCGY